MSNLSSVTANINIQQPELWNLLLSIHRKHIDLALYNQAENNSLISATIPLNEDDNLKTVENAVYDNPVLLSEFKQTRVLINAPHFILIPPQLDQQHQPLLKTSFPDENLEPAICNLPNCNLSIAYNTTVGLIPFLQRTFNNPPIAHRLMPLCEQLVTLNNYPTPRLYINLHGAQMDIIAFQDGKPLMANTFNIRNNADATFLALHAAECLKLEPKQHEIQLFGERTIQQEITSQLRTYFRYVTPAPYPAQALKISQHANKVPLDLILLAICE